MPPRASLWSAERRSLLRIAALVWLSFGFIQCAQSYVYALAAGRTWSLWSALRTGMPWWLSWLALTPIIALLAERFPFAAGSRMRSLGSQIVACVIVCSVQLTVVGSIYWWVTGRDAGTAPSMGNQVQRFFGNYFLESVVTYAAATGVLVAIDFARAIRDKEVERAQLEARAAALEASATKARLEALSMELNPHFLFNTLTAISGLVAHDRRTEAREVIQKLGALLRQTLNGSNEQLSSIDRELQLLDDYLFIQHVRFSDRLSVAIDVDEDARALTLPSMLLQPLVENAIRHGIEPKEGRGEVRIVVRRDNGTLRIAITDSGAGFKFNGHGRPAHEGIGIANTRARLEHLYGDKAELTLSNRPEGGASAVVTIRV